MDNVRLFLWLTFFAILWLAYSAWTADYPSAPSPQSAPSPAATGDQSSAAPAADTLPSLNGAPGTAEVEPPAAQAAPSTADLVHVRTDVLDVLIDLHGGDLVRADLPEYPVEKHKPNEPVRLLNYSPDERWVFQTGVRNATDGPEPDHLASYRTSSHDYSLASGQDELTVTLDWVGGGAVTAHKTYTFRRGSYAIDLALAVDAPAGATWRGAPYAQMTRVYHPVQRSFFNRSGESISFRGPVLFDGRSYSKLSFDKLVKQPVMQTVEGGWFASIQHHFLAAAVPPLDDAVHYQASTRGQEYVLSALGSVHDVTAGMPLDYRFTLFVGPKLQDQLKAAGPKLERAVDYGYLTVLAQPLFWLLSHIEDYVHNWGWSIVIVTFLIKLAFYRLTAASGRSMAKMRRLAPRMKALQERYKDDREALSKGMLELYKREKVNPAAGCLPIVIQMPFFFAWYWVLVESVEMRQAPFMLWIDDLSAQDPYYVLPLLMGVAMFFQTRLNPPPPDPMQARVMQIMPIVFTAFFLFFPSGLVLYWLTNTTLSILQQWRINKVVAREQTAS